MYLEQDPKHESTEAESESGPLRNADITKGSTISARGSKNSACLTFRCPVEMKGSSR